ncbi:hypothetical protein BD311DRAFT_772022 [Dichomitus squalens]|uniref:Uncharacterized protein n=1 Tax=Dichomitus squalens TaxID=114155 RepID=A0A4Q9M791_9APHY|nr:hypothetical protein BD311DRAFT_772022 [Dichomitus squalens]
MVKSKEDVIAQFNEEVNMTVEELEAWLEDPKSLKAGTGVGIESGHKIIEILRKNPTRDPEKYDEEDLEHMRKVVGYANRHMAQEDRLKETKTRDELEDTKSTISLKNWGHDPVKTLDDEKGDEVGADSGVNGHDSTDAPEEGEPSQSQEVEIDEQVKLDAEEGQKPKEAKKRKLDADEPKDQGATEEEAPESNDDDELEGGEMGDEKSDGIEGNNEEENQNEPPRKKTKNDAA